MPSGGEEKRVVALRDSGFSKLMSFGEKWNMEWSRCACREMCRNCRGWLEGKIVSIERFLSGD